MEQKATLALLASILLTLAISAAIAGMAYNKGVADGMATNVGNITAQHLPACTICIKNGVCASVPTCEGGGSIGGLALK